MRNSILFIHPGILAPVQGGGPTRTRALMDYFRAEGYEIVLVTSNHGEHNPELSRHVDKLYTPGAAQTNRRKHPEASSRALAARLKRKAKEAAGLVLKTAERGGMPALSSMQRNRHRSLETLAGKAACACRPVAAIATYAWLARALDYMPPGTLRILDTIDVQHVRCARARQSGGNLEHLRCSREEEARELRRADILLAIQDEEERLLREMCPDRSVLCVRHAVSLPAFTTPPAGEANNLLYVGNKYDPNIRGLQSFFDTAWPAIVSRRPEVRLTVCGRICEVFPDSIPNVTFAGVVPDLNPFYESAHIVINPVTYGTGIKIKSIEALAHGRCLVCTSQGTLGLGAPESLPVVVAETGAEMVEAILTLLSDTGKRHALETESYTYARNHFSPQQIFKDLHNCIRDHNIARGKGDV